MRYNREIRRELDLTFHNLAHNEIVSRTGTFTDTKVGRPQTTGAHFVADAAEKCPRDIRAQ